jgi:hypothetical protein
MFFSSSRVNAATALRGRFEICQCRRLIYEAKSLCEKSDAPLTSGRKSIPVPVLVIVMNSLQIHKNLLALTGLRETKIDPDPGELIDQFVESSFHVRAVLLIRYEASDSA